MQESIHESQKLSFQLMRLCFRLYFTQRDREREAKIPPREGTTATLRVAIPSFFDLPLFAAADTHRRRFIEESPRESIQRKWDDETLYREDDYPLIFPF